MVSIDTHGIHDISWIDLAARDVDAAVEFYGGLFGWTAMNDGVTPYSIFMVGDQPVGGVMALPPEMGEMPPVWSTYVNVADADATIAAVKAAGGSVFQEPFEIPDSGRIAVIGDPAQAAICLFEGGSEGFKLKDEVGAPCWFDCSSRDIAASVEFYKTVFGWTAEAMSFEGGMDYTVFANNGEPICGAMAMPPMVPAEVPSHWGINVVVADCDAAVAYVAEKGGMVVRPPEDTPFGRAANIIDPQGAGLGIIDRSTATED